MTITADELRKILIYDRQTGYFIWRCNMRGPVKAGDIAGRMKPNGYRSIKLHQVDYYEHRLAHLYVTGEWPSSEIDHINRNRSDNRWSNLREASRSQNRGNTKLHARNTSGLRGVGLFRTGMWRARLGTKTIGYFKTKEAAHAAYVVAARERFGEFAPAIVKKK